MMRGGGGRWEGTGKFLPDSVPTISENGRNSVLESALRVMKQANMDLRLSPETKVANRVHMITLVGYCDLADKAPIRLQGGISVFYRNALHFQGEAYHLLGPKVDIFQLAYGSRQWLVVDLFQPKTPALSTRALI